MKTITASLRTHLDQEATSLCTCWIIEREDGQMFYFTDHDEDVLSGGQTYKSVGAYKRTAVASTDTLSVDNLDIEGITNELVLPRDELIVGLYDRAAIKVFMTRWDGGPADPLKIRRGFFGQVQVLPNGTFSVELRGLMQHLTHTFTSLYTASCLHDLGDSDCMIPIDVAPVLRSTSYAVGDYVSAAPAGDTFKLVIKEQRFLETTTIAASTGWWKLVEGTITLSGPLLTADAFTVDDGTNPPIQFVGDTDFTVGVSAIADATALAVAINQATPLSVTATDDLAGGITLRNNLETDGTITEDVDSGGVATVVDFVDGDMSLTAPGIGAFNGSQNLRGGTTTGVVVQDIDVLLSGVSAAAIDTGNCLLDIWAWRLGTDNAATFEVEALDANMDFLATLFTTTSEAIIDDTEWVKRGTKQKLIPTLTRFLRIKFTATLTGTPPILQYFDNVYGWVVDPAGAGAQLAPYEELIFRCTQAGTTGASQGADDYPAGAIGAVTTDGTAKFVGEEAWTRGASAISVTEGSSRIFRAEPQEYRAVTGWYNGGIVEFITGANAGGKMEIKTWTRDGAPTSTASRVEYTLGTADQIPFIPWSDRSHINWDTGSVYWHASSLGGLTETFAEYSILTLAQVTAHDMTKSPEFTTGVEISGVDPHTGYMSGAHYEFVGGGDDHYWEYVFNPATDTYVTINDNFANARTTDFLGDLQTGHCYLTHATSGLQAVVSTNQTEVRVHSFPGLVFQKSWDVVFPVQAGWAKAAVIDARSDEAYLVTNRTDTSFEIFKLTIDVAGVVSRVSIGTVTNSDFPPAVTAMDKFESRLVPHYDAVTDTIFFNAPMKHGASFTRYGVSYDVPGETVNWTTQLPSSNIDSGAFPHYYARLDGGYWGRNVGTFDYLLVNLVTGDWEQRWGASNNPDVHAVFWDDTTDSFYALTHDGPFASQAMIKTRYVTVTIAPGTIELFLSLPFAIEAGDLFTLSPGCDKARVTCAALFDNVIKMLAAPDVPGQDALFSYPDVKS